MSKVKDFFKHVGHEMSEGFHQIGHGLKLVGNDLKNAGDDLVHGDFRGMGQDIGKAGSDWMNNIPEGLAKTSPGFAFADTLCKHNLSKAYAKIGNFDGRVLDRMASDLGGSVEQVRDGAGEIVNGQFTAGLKDLAAGSYGLAGDMTWKGLAKATVETGAGMFVQDRLAKA